MTVNVMSQVEVHEVIKRNDCPVRGEVQVIMSIPYVSGDRAYTDLRSLQVEFPDARFFIARSLVDSHALDPCSWEAGEYTQTWGLGDGGASEECVYIVSDV